MVYSRVHTVTLGRKSAWDIRGRHFSWCSLVIYKTLIKKYACITILCAGLDARSLFINFLLSDIHLPSRMRTVRGFTVLGC